jgi:hypothetical protein
VGYGAYEHRPQGKAKLIPAKAFEYERHYLAQLPAHPPAPYQVHWVPGIKRQEVKILQYSDRLKIYLARECLAENPLPGRWVSNQRFSAPQLPTPPCQPKNRRYPSAEEEKRAARLGPGSQPIPLSRSPCCTLQRQASNCLLPANIIAGDLR